MKYIQGTKKQGVENLKGIECNLYDYIQSISIQGHRESYNSLCKKFVVCLKDKQKIDTDIVSIKAFFTPQKIHSICYTVASDKIKVKNGILPYCHYDDSNGEFIILFSTYNKVDFEKCYAIKKASTTIFDPLKMINGLLSSEKYANYWTADKLNSITSVINAMLENSVEK